VRAGKNYIFEGWVQTFVSWRVAADAQRSFQRGEIAPSSMNE
jgi:hypothetical protein